MNRSIVKSVFNYSLIFFSFLFPLILLLALTPINLQFEPFSTGQQPYLEEIEFLKNEIKSASFGTNEYMEKLHELEILEEKSSREQFDQIQNELNSKEFDFIEILEYNIWIPIFWMIYFLAIIVYKRGRQRR